MRLVLVGPPGSGKGTQAELLTKNLNLKYIGTGNILRDAINRKTEYGLRAKPFLDVGELAPDDLVNSLVADLYRDNAGLDRFVLDGYPRTRAQAVWFDDLLKTLKRPIDAVIQLSVNDEEVVRRISGRRVCPKCGTVYHVTDRPPKVPGICDHDGEKLIQRPDDNETVIRARLKVFHSNTDSLLDYYRDKGLLCEQPSYGSVDSIYQSILGLIQAKKH